MTREEIRGIIEGYLFYDKLTGYDDEDVTKLLKELASVGVVIKVEDGEGYMRLLSLVEE